MTDTCQLWHKMMMLNKMRLVTPISTMRRKQLQCVMYPLEGAVFMEAEKVHGIGTA